MSEPKFKSQICTTMEQSNRLLELGLKPETADMCYTNASLPFIKDDFHIVYKEYSQLNKEVNYEISPFTFIPAWSLHRLIELYRDVEDTSLLMIKDVSTNLLIFCIEKAIRCNVFNKQYLNK